MPDPEDLHPTLRRQLKRAGITSTTSLPTAENWATLLSQVDTAYRDTEQSDRLNDHAARVASEEMHELYHNLEERVNERTRDIAQAHEELEALHEALSASEEQFRLVAENTSDIVFLVDSDGRHAWVAPAVEQVLGFEPDELVGMDAKELIHPQDLPTIENARRGLLSGEPSVKYEARIRTASGEYRWMSGVASFASDSEGTRVGRLVTLRDIEEQVASREALARSEQLFRLAMDGAPQGLTVLDLELGFRQVNSAMCALVDRDEDWMLTHSLPDVVTADSVDAVLKAQSALMGGGEKESHEGRWLQADDSLIWVSFSMSLLRDAHGEPLFFILHAQDNTDAHLRSADLAHRASHDPLTGLRNREKLSQQIHELSSNEGQDGTGLLYLDLDNFRQVNNKYGHNAGDDMLVETAQRILDAIRHSDLAARIGGDEFIVVLADIPTVEVAGAMAEKIRAAVSAPIETSDGHLLSTTVSIGYTLGDAQSDSSVLMRQADSALFEAKRSGRDRCMSYRPGNAQSDASEAPAQASGAGRRLLNLAENLPTPDDAARQDHQVGN